MESIPNSIICSSCTNYSDVNQPARQWCQDCGEGLCDYCRQTDGDLHDTHKIVEIEEYLKVPVFIRSFEKHCLEHKLEYTKFCSIHDKPLCKTCVQMFHLKCNSIHDIANVLKNESRLDTFQSSYIDANSTLFALLEATSLASDNIESFKSQCTAIEKSVRKTGEKIKKHIDSLTNAMLEKLETTKHSTLDGMECVLERLKLKTKPLKEFVNNTTAIKAFASKFQTFMCTREISKLLYDANVFLESLDNERKLDSINLSYEEESKITAIQKLGALGMVKMHTKHAPKILITTENVTTAQAETINPLPKQISFLKKFSMTPQNYTGHCLLDNGKMIFTDYNNDRLCFYTEEGTHFCTYNLNGLEAFDICTIADNRIAISGGRSGISIFKIENSTVSLERTWKDPSWLFGISGNRSKLFTCSEKNGIKSLDLKTCELSLEIEDKNVCEDSYVAARSDTIVYTVPKHNKVIIYNLQFRSKKEFEDDYLLCAPKGVAIDEQMNIFVGGSDSYNVVVISKDCQSYKQILEKKDGFTEPVSIHFCEKTKQIIILDVNSCVKFYSVIY